MSLIDAYGWDQLCPNEQPKEKNKQIMLYAARDRNSGKLISTLTSPGHKFWQKRQDCMNAILKYNSGSSKHRNYDLELVTYVLVEVPQR